MEQNGGLKYNIGTLSSLEATRNDPPSIDLILAVPRPLRLERILPIISCMGVNKLFLVGANKVEKDYFGELVDDGSSTSSSDDTVCRSRLYPISSESHFILLRCPLQSLLLYPL